jgi:hypothetical protein
MRRPRDQRIQIGLDTVGVALEVLVNSPVVYRVRSTDTAYEIMDYER